MVDKSLKEKVINKFIPFPVILAKAGYDGYSYDGKVMCPFHQNYDTPAAKIYKDKDGDKLFCFSEHHMYRPIDVIKRGLLKADIDTIFDRIWCQLDSDVQKTLKEDVGEQFEVKGWEENKENLEKFMVGELSFNGHLQLIKTILSI